MGDRAPFVARLFAAGSFAGADCGAAGECAWEGGTAGGSGRSSGGDSAVIALGLGRLASACSVLASEGSPGVAAPAGLGAEAMGASVAGRDGFELTVAAGGRNCTQK